MRKIAAVQGQVVDLLPDNGNAKLRRRRFQCDGIVLHLDDFVDRSGFQREVIGGGLVHQQDEARLHRGTEAAHGYF